MTAHRRLAWLPALAVLFAAAAASAYDQPAVNLGFTSFLDGIPPAGPGWYVAQYVQYYSADELTDLPLPPDFAGADPQLDAWISLTQIIYQHPRPVIGGANLGLDLILPAADFDLKADGTPLTANDGIGDLLVGPYLQWAPLMGANGPVFVHRIELQTILPTGDYDEQRSINPGANVVSLDPYWAATWFLTPKWTVSGRFHYLWNAKNCDPNSPDPTLDDVQAGQAVHANFATEYELLAKHLRVGFNGYAFRQITASQANGRDVDGEKEQVVGLGPGALWSFGPADHLFVNVYFETEAQSRPEGERVNVRFVHHF